MAHCVILWKSHRNEITGRKFDGNKKNEVVTEEKTNIVIAEAVQVDIRSLIYVVRGQQVMLDNDLAMLYQVETKALNRSVKRNINRFPEDFMFQLSEDEYQTLRCQIGTSKTGEANPTEGRGGRRYLPYAFTEQGISMLASVLRSDVAVNVSIGIIDDFDELFNLSIAILKTDIEWSDLPHCIP